MPGKLRGGSGLKREGILWGKRTGATEGIRLAEVILQKIWPVPERSRLLLAPAVALVAGPCRVGSAWRLFCRSLKIQKRFGNEPRSACLKLLVRQADRTGRGGLRLARRGHRPREGDRVMRDPPRRRSWSRPFG